MSAKVGIEKEEKRGRGKQRGKVLRGGGAWKAIGKGSFGSCLGEGNDL